MGIYYFAVDTSDKSYFNPPRGFTYKFPGICYPENPFPGMVIMENCRGAHYEIVNDVGYELPDGYKDVTDEVYEEYQKLFAEYFSEKDNDKDE